MPYYDFYCDDCQKHLTLFYKSYAAYDVAVHTCSLCHSTNVRRRIGRVAVAKSEDARLDALADDSVLAGVDENDPRTIGRFMRTMSREMGEELGAEFDEVVDRLEKGQSPDQIEQSVPGLADTNAPLDDGLLS